MKATILAVLTIVLLIITAPSISANDDDDERSISRVLACGDLGDVNANGVVDRQDRKIILKHLQSKNKNHKLTDDQIRRADVDGNKEVSHDDANLIRDYIKGKIDTFPGCVRARGTLRASIDISSPPSRLFVAGTPSAASAATLAVIRINTDRVESVSVESIKVDTGHPSAVSACFLFDGAGNRVGLNFQPGRICEFPSPKGNLAVIPANSSMIFTVKAMFVPIGSGVENGDSVQVSLLEVKGTGVASEEGVDTIIGSSESARHWIYAAYPSFAVNPASPSGNLVPNKNTLLARFNIASVGNADVTFDEQNSNQLLVMVSKRQNDGPWGQECVLMDDSGNVLDSTFLGSPPSPSIGGELRFSFSTNGFIVPAGQTKQLAVYCDTTNLEDPDDTIQLWLDDNKPTNVGWGIDGTGNHHHGDFIFRGDIFAGVLTN